MLGKFACLYFQDSRIAMDLSAIFSPQSANGIFPFTHSFTIPKLRCFVILIHTNLFQTIHFFTALDLEAKNVFDEFDKDKSGKISAQELGTAVRMLGLNPTMKELENVIKKIDRNGVF